MKKFLKTHSRWIFFCILTLALILRLINIDWSLDQEKIKFSSFVDEPFSYVSADQFRPLEGSFSTGDWSLIKGTFFYEITGTINDLSEKTGLKKLLFPKSNANDASHFYASSLIMRFTVIIFALGIICFIFLLSQLLFKNEAISLLAAFSYAIFPQEIAFSNIIGADIPLAFFIIATLYLTLKAYQTKNLRLLLWAGLFSGFATATKYTGITVTLPIAICFFHLTFAKKVSFINFSKNFAKGFQAFLGFLIGFLIGQPLSITEPQKFIKGIVTQFNYQTGAFEDGIGQLPNFIFYFSNILLYGLGIGFLLLSLAGVIYYFAKNFRNKTHQILISWLLVYYLGLSIASWTTTRYSLPLTPFLAIFISFFIVQTLEIKKLKVLFIPLVSLAYVYSLLFTYQFISALNGPDPYQQFSQYDSENLKLESLSTLKNGHQLTLIPFYNDYPIIEHSGINYPLLLLPTKVLKENPALEIATDYIILDDHSFRNAKRIKDEPTTKFLSRFEHDYKKAGEFELIETFQTPLKLLLFKDHQGFYSSDLNLLFKKISLYKKSQIVKN